MLVGCAQIPSAAVSHTEVAAAEDWRSVIDAPCKRCAPSKSDRDRVQVRLPKRAVVYSFTGEFARSSHWWLINLDTGEITERESAADKDGNWTTTTEHFGKVEVVALDNLRASAAKLWRSEPYDALRWYPPGTAEDDFVLSGSQLVAFSRFASNDRYVVTAIDAALPSDAPKSSGSFTIIGPRKNAEEHQ